MFRWLNSHSKGRRVIPPYRRSVSAQTGKAPRWRRESIAKNARTRGSWPVASDDDPGGIGTHSQVGAQFDCGLLWTMVLSYPRMAAIQEISARIGRVTSNQKVMRKLVIPTYPAIAAGASGYVGEEQRQYRVDSDVAKDRV